MLDELVEKYQKMQNKYGDKNLDAILFGGLTKKPDICLVFMNPTARNIAASKEWRGLKAPWIGTKNVWKLFYKLEMIDKDLFEKIQNIKGKDWTNDLAKEVYQQVTKNKFYITNLAKCSQVDARSLNDSIYKKYLELFFKEMEIVKPKVIILFGNQVSSIVLNEKISVSQVRKKKFQKRGFNFYAVYYPVGNGSFNALKAIEDISYIKKNVVLNDNL